jgi:hypothetical protein
MRQHLQFMESIYLDFETLRFDPERKRREF